MAIDIATRPSTIDGCWGKWDEEQLPNTVRSTMDSGATKVRRRTTGIARLASVMVTLKAEQYDDFVSWWNVNQQQGVKPTRVMTPYGKEEVWRWVAPPQISWLDPGAFQVSVEMEQLPAWRSL